MENRCYNTKTTFRVSLRRGTTEMGAVDKTVNQNSMQHNRYCPGGCSSADCAPACKPKQVQQWRFIPSFLLHCPVDLTSPSLTKRTFPSSHLPSPECLWSIAVTPYFSEHIQSTATLYLISPFFTLQSKLLLNGSPVKTFLLKTY